MNHEAGSRPPRIGVPSLRGSTMPPLSKPLALWINGAAVPRVDPFLTHHRGTRRGRKNTSRLEMLESRSSRTPSRTSVSFVQRTDGSAGRRHAARLAGLLHLPGAPASALGNVVSDHSQRRDEASSRAYRSTFRTRWTTSGPSTSRSLPHPAARGETTARANRGPDRPAQPAGCMQYRGRGRRDDQGGPAVEPRSRSAAPSAMRSTGPSAGVDALRTAGRPSQPALGELLAALESTFPVEDAYNRLGGDNRTPRRPSSRPSWPTSRTRCTRRRSATWRRRARLAFVEPFSSINDLESFLREASVPTDAIRRARSRCTLLEQYVTVSMQDRASRRGRGARQAPAVQPAGTSAAGRVRTSGDRYGA